MPLMNPVPRHGEWITGAAEFDVGVVTMVASGGTANNKAVSSLMNTYFPTISFGGCVSTGGEARHGAQRSGSSWYSSTLRRVTSARWS